MNPKTVADPSEATRDANVDDCCKDSTADMDVEEAEEPTADEGPHDSNDEVADKTKAVTLDDLAIELKGRRPLRQAGLPLRG